MKKRIWLSYDLGVRGDYESLYRWLDSIKAVECGDSVASFEYEWAEGKDSLRDTIKDDLKNSVDLKTTDRIYLVWKEGGFCRGAFIVGKRKAAPWAGYSFEEAAGTTEGE